MIAGIGSAEETNAPFKYLLQPGQTGLSISFGLPMLYCYNTDPPKSAGEYFYRRKSNVTIMDRRMIDYSQDRSLVHLDQDTIHEPANYGL